MDQTRQSTRSRMNWFLMTQFLQHTCYNRQCKESLKEEVQSATSIATLISVASIASGQMYEQDPVACHVRQRFHARSHGLPILASHKTWYVRTWCTPCPSMPVSFHRILYHCKWQSTCLTPSRSPCTAHRQGYQTLRSAGYPGCRLCQHEMFVGRMGLHMACIQPALLQES